MATLMRASLKTTKPFKLASKLHVSVSSKDIEESATSFNIEIRALTEDNKVFKGICLNYSLNMNFLYLLFQKADGFVQVTLGIRCNPADKIRYENEVETEL